MKRYTWVVYMHLLPRNLSGLVTVALVQRWQIFNIGLVRAKQMNSPRPQCPECLNKPALFLVAPASTYSAILKRSLAHQLKSKAIEVVKG